MSFFFFKILSITIILLHTKVKCEDIFKGIKKLSLNDNYFVALNTGLYLYNYNLLNRALITSFNSSVYKNDNDIIIIKELIYNNYFYVICLVNKYLFLFNEKNNITNSFLIDEDDIIPSNYYDLLPYKVINNLIQFFISLNKSSSITLFYFIISLETSKMEKSNQFNNEINVINKLVRCLINNNKSQIYCFYIERINNINYLQLMLKWLSNDIKMLHSQIFTVYTLMGKTYTNLTSSDKEINELKVVLSSNNKFFITILIDGNLYFYIYEYSTSESNILQKTGCNDGATTNINYKLYYFEETKDFVIVGRYQGTIFIINSYNNSTNICSQKYFPEQTSSYDFNIIYNNTIKLYI